MPDEIRVALIGLDTSHTIEFTRRMQAPDVKPDQKVEGIKAVTCLRFSTPFQSEEGLNQRQAQLEAWGVKVTRDFDEAVAGCDALMLEINDGAYHLEYFKKSMDLGKPIFLDKPLADNIQNGKIIYDLAKNKKLRVFSASSLRFVPQLIEACNAVPEPAFATMYGPLGKAPAGSSIVWYGVHAFEMLERAIGRGAVSVFAVRDKAGAMANVEYKDARRGLVELSEGSWLYGGNLRTKDKSVPFVVNMSRAYSDLLTEIAKFFKGGKPPVSMDDTLEIMGMLDAAERSFQSGKPEKI
ncbi:MAG TPA: Gfo/Idh/MocA family oxidoreductase [Armatimonadota bacterium]|nr:Gfo/Idh/MocA family oxidoreductase [Armatimonadota bacterium]